VVSFNTLISACILTGNVNRAKELVRKTMLEGPWPNVITFGGVIEACAKLGEIERAEKWLDTMVER
jgi:pentatricopeptide repeat protein